MSKTQCRPNILWIVSDQHNPHIAGFAGAERSFTPNLDRLARSGTHFTSAYCQSPLCVPSRISFLTGKYPFRCDAYDNASVLAPEHVTIARHLAMHGYATVLVGKAHLRGPQWMGDFDERPYGDLRVGRFCFHQPDPTETWDGRWNSHSVGRFPWAGATRIPESMLNDGIASREAVAALHRLASARPAKPWLLCVGYSRPHFPLTAPERYIRRAMENLPPLPLRPEGYPDALHPHDRFIVNDFHLQIFPNEEQQHALACYYACVNYLDDCIGELLEAMDRLDMLEDTIVVYTSDHGDMAGEHGLWWKRTYYDASAAVPLLIAGPGLGSEATVNTPVELVDLFPTFCDLAGVPVPEGLDGESLLPLCRGRLAERLKKTARSELLGERPETAFRMIRSERWKYVTFPETSDRLFDLEHDARETRDQLAEAPSSEVKGAAAQLHDELLGGRGWDEIARMRQQDARRWTDIERHPDAGPTQYRLADGRIVEADISLYPELG
ncbi:sulfatase-like hydrolase/transferase [Verrucomicrobiota bacterium]